MTGKKQKAPCGHDGETVIGTYVRCLTPGCDGLARDHKPFKPTFDYSKLESDDEEDTDPGGWRAVVPYIHGKQGTITVDDPGQGDTDPTVCALDELLKKKIDEYNARHPTPSTEMSVSSYLAALLQEESDRLDRVAERLREFLATPRILVKP